VKVGNNVTENDKLRRYVEGLKDEVRTVVRVGMVDGRYTIFAHVNRAAEALDFELWRSRRKTNTAGSSTIWQATKSTTGASSRGAANHHKTGRYPVPVNAMRKSHKLSKEDTARYLRENYVLVVVNPATWRVLVLKRGRTRGKRLRKLAPTGGPCVVRV
jgi:hypothetical protein